VLRYCQNSPSRSTVRKYYARYRVENGMPDRCDILICIFHTQPLIWNNASLPLILDHIDGCRENNSPSNLRYLCPNCDSEQSATRGGANQGRVQDRGECGYSILERGSQDRHVKAFDGARFTDEPTEVEMPGGGRACRA